MSLPASIRRLAAACLAGLLLPLPALAQGPDAEWQAYEAALNDGARQAGYWQAGWTTIYAGSLALNTWQASEASSRDDRYDARVGVVKSALALGGMFLDRQPHPAASRELAAGEPGDIDGARALLEAVAAEEQRRRSWEARLGSLAVNTAAGLLIAVGDGRERDGAINFATGMLVSELQLQTQPRQATAAINRFR
ncbi:hypothetical protein, partial [Halomonas sp. A11-A]|uniref:hypothetical protein n=1 Tax=Halomonas sp. A11-A TaxID=2183985 RepID=UPI000D9A0C20